MDEIASEPKDNSYFRKYEFSVLLNLNQVRKKHKAFDAVTGKAPYVYYFSRTKNCGEFSFCTWVDVLLPVLMKKKIIKYFQPTKNRLGFLRTGWTIEGAA
jgi:hypothetical protein